MTRTEMFGEPRSRRLQLAAELQRLREQAGVSGRQLARRIGISQPKVSRIEAGIAMPSVPQVAAWTESLGTTPETRERLCALTEALYVDVQAWRRLLKDRPHLQHEIGLREGTARRTRTFQPSIVPGLLQTAEYAARVFAMSQLPYTANEVAQAVAGRMSRQAALYREGGQFEFLVTESALRWRLGADRLVIAQLDRIAALITVDSISFGVIPQHADVVITIPHGFVIYDGEPDGHTYVNIETIHASVDVVDPPEVALYEEHWSLLYRMAVFGDAARNVVAGLMADLHGAIR